MAVTVTQELVTKFGFIGSTEPLHDFNGALGGSIKLLGGMFLALQGASAGFSLWADGVLEGVDSLGQLSRQTRIAVSDLQELDYIAGQSGSSADAMRSSITSLNAAIGSAAIQGSEDFSRLGISVRDAAGQVKTADTVLDEVRQRFIALNLSMAEQEHFASALGLDASLLQLLNRTDAEMAGLRDRARELGTLTEEQVRQAEDYKRSLDSMWFSLNNVKQLVAVGVAPEMGRLADEFAQLLADNREWIVGGIQATIRFVGDLLDAFHRLTPAFGILAAGFGLWKIATLGLSGALGILLSPVALVTAGVVGLLLIVDDLIVAFGGGQSVIADFFNEFLGVDIVPIMRGVVDAVADAFGTIMDVGGGLMDFFVSLFGGLGDLLAGNFSSGIDRVWSAFLNLGQNLFDNLFGPLFASLRDAVMSILPDWAVRLIGGDSSAEPDRASPVAPLVDPAVIEAIPTTIPVGTGTASNVQNDNRQFNVSISNDIKSSDPEAAGRAVGDTLQRQLDNAQTQFSVGGR